MTPLKVDAVARRRQVAPVARSARRVAGTIPPRPRDDPRSSTALRGLLFGIPIGLAMWALLAFVLWRIA